jgi:Ankyrin repeats (many copies)
MKLRMLFAAAMSLAVLGSSAAIAGDPFDDARYAIGIKQNETALKLVDSGAIDINMQTDEGYTLLHYAADAGNLEMVNALLARGADPTIKAKTGSTPYDMAMGSTMKVLLAKAQAEWRAKQGGEGGDMPSAPVGGAEQQSQADSSGNGICAAVRGEPVNNGRSPALRPLLKARDDIWYNHPDELAALLDDCVDANAKGPMGSTLLHVAAERDRVDAARILLAHGARKSATDASGKTAAAYASSPEMKALLGPAPAAAKAKDGATAASADRKKECRQKWYADQALQDDSSGKAAAYRRWQQCLKTGLYW